MKRCVHPWSGRRGARWSRARRAAGLVAWVALAAACTSPAEPEEESPAYDFMLPIGAGVVYHWAPGSTVRIYVDPTADPARDRLLEGAVDEAMRAWSEALEGADIALTRVGALSEAAVLVRWADSPLPVATEGCEPVVLGRAATTFCPTADYATLERFPINGAEGPTESAVRMIVTVLPEEAVGERRVRQLVTHEFGHVLGIGGHSPNPGDLMWDGPLGPDRPTASDLATLRRLYSTPATLVP
jgi:predicted Zn-dependent protease